MIVFDDLLVLIPLLAALGAAPLVALAGALRADWAPPAAIGLAALAFVATLWAWLNGGGSVALLWAPSWDLQLAFALDGLAALYALLATGIGLLVVIYAARYLPSHLEHQGRPAREASRFFTLITLFMGAMVGLATAQDLVLLIVFWDLTTVTSYFLIGYDRQKAESRDSALMALLVTGIAAFFLIIAAVLVYAEYRTFSIATLRERTEPGPLLTLVGLLVALAALAKSAQAPLHFWLPRAMAAPTPVSAYLHSAAMVAAGVFLIQRVYPLFEQHALLLDLLLVVGLVSMLVGGVLALTHDVLKQVLAYSTIAQYGYVVTMLGLGGEIGIKSAVFYVLAHALIKSALFMTAGAVTEATEADRLSQAGGLWRRLPLLAVASGVAAAGLAAAPLTIGFFKDELFFDAALHRSTLFAGVAVAGAATTVAYTWRFWSGIFLGHPRSDAHPISWLLVAPVVVCAALVLLGGVVVAPFAHLAAAAASSALGAPLAIEVAYHLDPRPTNLMALAAYALGALLVVTRPFWRRAADAFASLGERAGPARWYALSLEYLRASSRWSFAVEWRDLRSRIATILFPAAVLIGMGVLATPTGRNTYLVGHFTQEDLPLAMSLLLVAGAALALVRVRGHLAIVLALSIVGYGLVGVYAFFGAPDVALVAVLVETILTLFMLGVLSLFPRNVLARIEHLVAPARKRLLDASVAVIAGVGAFVVAWGVLSRPASQRSVAAQQIWLTPAAHAGDVVTAILSDFRGLDTAGEITVVGIVLLGMVGLLRQWRTRS